MEIGAAETPASGMDLDGASPSDSNSNPSSSELIEPDQHALDAVEFSPPPRRRRRVYRSSSGSPRHTHSSSSTSSSDGSESSDEPWSVPSPDDIAVIMARYHELQREFTQQQLALAPDVIPANQALLAARVGELIQQRRGKWLQAAEPTGTHETAAATKAAAAAAAKGGGSTDQYSSHKGDNNSDSEDAPPAAAAGAAAGDTHPASRSKSRPYIAKFSSNEGKAYSRKAFRLHYEQRIPEYVSWSYLMRNEVASGHGQRMFYTDETGETVPASDDEGSDQKPWNSTDGPSHDYALLQLIQEQQGRRSYVLRALEIGLEQDEEHVTTDELLRRWEYLIDQAHPQQAPKEADRRQLDFRESTAKLHAHFCRRCNIYNCRLHGGNHIKPVRAPKPTPVTPATAPPCGDNCWKHAVPGNSTRVTAAAAAGDGIEANQQQQQQQPAAAAAAAVAVPDLGAYELGLLQQGIQCMGRDPCSLALLLLDRSCAEVAAYLATLPEEEADSRENMEVEGGAAEAAAAASRRKPKKKGWGGSKKDDRSARRHVTFTRERMRARGDELPPYTPCKCEGPCRRGSCSCIDSANYCEKYCGCVGCETRDCYFQGCKCTSLCRTELCPCMAEGRECDPEMCRNCPATAEGRALPDQCCSNMGIRLRRYKRIHMGLSSVAGWGAFLAEPAKKGDFLGEYVGETLTSHEADRRGKAYDRSNNSYLFAVNSECVLDARDAGNKLRFANHKSAPNCHARVLLVEGDHRVGLYAKEDIAAGEELFYNYRYDLDNAPDWAIKG